MNAIDSDVWLNIPSTTNETARDEYVTSLLTLMDALLPAGKKMYVEHANECMFGNNQCYQDDTTTANITVLEQGDPYKLNFGLPSPPNASNLISHWNPRMYAYTAFHFATLARSLFGAARVGRADVPGVRVVPVLGANGGYAADGATKLDWLNDAWGPPAAAGLATMNIGGYWSASRNVSGDPNVTVDEAMTSLLANIAADSPLAPTSYTSSFAGYSTVGAYYGIAMHAYEGGPDTSGGKGAGVLTLGKACADPRMEDAVTSIVATWQSWGLGTFNYFTLGAQPLEQPWGSYTNLWDLTITDTPKTRGIDKIVGSPPAQITAGWPAPLVRHNASFFVGYYSPTGLPPTTPEIAYNNVGAQYSYLVRFEKPCALGINVTVTMAVLMNRVTKKVGGETLGVSVGAFLPTQSLLSPVTNGSANDLASVTALFDPMPPAALSNGLVAVRLSAPGPPVNVNVTNYRFVYVDVACR